MARMRMRVEMELLLTKKVVFPSKPSEMLKVLHAILTEICGSGFNEDVVFAIRLALDEALSNAVRHGNCGDPSKQVTVEYSITDEGFKASVTDQGCGFHPDELPNPTLEENIERPCGRGVMLMKAYMSCVTYNKNGNSVTITKHRDCTLPNRAQK